MPPNAPNKKLPVGRPDHLPAHRRGADGSHVWFVPAVGAGLRIGLITVG